jgi:hypothetical protein
MLTESDCKNIAQHLINYFEKDKIFKEAMKAMLKPKTKRNKYISADDDEYYDKHKEYMRTYYQRRKKEILTRQKMKTQLDNDYYECPCGGLFRKVNKSIHEKSKRHEAWESAQKIVNKGDGINFYKGSQVVKIHYGSTIEL